MAQRKFVVKQEWLKEWIDEDQLESVEALKVKQISKITETVDEHDNVLKVKNVRVVSHSLKLVGDVYHFDVVVKCVVIE